MFSECETAVLPLIVFSVASSPGVHSCFVLCATLCARGARGRLCLLCCKAALSSSLQGRLGFRGFFGIKVCSYLRGICLLFDVLAILGF